MFIRSGYSQPTVKVSFTSPSMAGATLAGPAGRAGQAWPCRCRAGIRCRPAGPPLSVGRGPCPDRARDWWGVVGPDKEGASPPQPLRLEQDLVEAGRILGQHDREAATRSLESLLAAEGWGCGGEPARHVPGVEAQRQPHGKGGEQVVGVVEAAERCFEAGAGCLQADAVQALQPDIGGGDLGLRPLEVAVWATVVPVVADVDGTEVEARAAAGAGAGVSRVRQLVDTHPRILEAVPERRRGERLA